MEPQSIRVAVTGGAPHALSTPQENSTPSPQKFSYSYSDLFLDPDPRIPFWKRIVGGAALPIVPFALFAACSDAAPPRSGRGIDAGSASDMGEDLAVKPDLGRDGMEGGYDDGKGEKPESISCGTDTCKAQVEVCCTDVLSGSRPVCIDVQDPCEGTVAACDGPEDCTDAVCCAEATFGVDVTRREGELNGRTECSPSCNFSFDFDPLTGQGEVTARACHGSGDCITTEPICCNTPGIGTGMCLTTSAAALAEEYTYGLMDCN